jgi:predicted phage tail protein
MSRDLRGELAVLTLGAAMWVLGVFAPGEWGRAFTGGGIVFTVIGLALTAVSLIRRGVQERP